MKLLSIPFQVDYYITQFKYTPGLFDVIID